MSSEAEALAPAEAAGSVSGTEGNSGRTKLSAELGILAGGFPGAAGFGLGPVMSKGQAVI